MAVPVGTGRALGVLTSVVNDLDSIGLTSGGKAGFYGKTPIVQPSSASQAAVVVSATATTTVLRAQLTATATLANALRLALVNLGLIKGAS